MMMCIEIRFVCPCVTHPHVGVRATRGGEPHVGVRATRGGEPHVGVRAMRGGEPHVGVRTGRGGGLLILDHVRRDLDEIGVFRTIHP
jgi:hypothetical protein